MAKVEAAIELKTKGALLAKAKTEGFRGMYFGNCTTLATRLRCEVIDVNINVDYHRLDFVD